MGGINTPTIKYGIGGLWPRAACGGRGVDRLVELLAPGEGGGANAEHAVVQPGMSSKLFAPVEEEGSK